MKNILLLLLVICPMLSWADPWDNMTLEQAEQVQKYLRSNPYLLDYCDCCDSEGEFATQVYLMQVISMEIVTCEWNPQYFSIRATVKRLAEVPYRVTGPDVSTPSVYISEDDITITMNYAWGYNAKVGKAAPLYTIIPYDIYGKQDLSQGYCREFISFPNPVPVKNAEYANWYKSRF
ncbi:hypothetical protein JMN32_07470 [Fulvivirga sp. 29W222]|uniref:Uncharacterized protein n=1 Tax=Fulvivirga marina TaxID=2494733 RepID=A0A937G0A3_9BACT|nr:hypothetical protein [Fulvivirga marina]MBL6446141.1 hypothetical protein [Fulvivirga marina]